MVGGKVEPIRGRDPVVLVVEDEDVVLKFILRVLEGQGYAVLWARNADWAHAICGAYAGTIDLLLTDMRMDNVEDGLDLAERIETTRPETNVLFTSGSWMPKPAQLDRRAWAFLPKPFGASALLSSVGALAPVPAGTVPRGMPAGRR